MKKILGLVFAVLFCVNITPVMAHQHHHDGDGRVPPPPPPPPVVVGTYVREYRQLFPDCNKHVLLTTETTTEYSDNTSTVSNRYSVLDSRGYVIISNVGSVVHLDDDYEHYFLVYADGHYMVIDSSGVMTSSNYYTTATILEPGRIRVSNNISLLKVEYGIIDYAGNVVVPLKYQAINSGNLNNGLYMTKLNGFWGLMDLDNNVYIRNENDSIKIILAAYKIKKDGKWGLVNINGQKVLDTKYDKIDTKGDFIIVKQDNLWAAFDAYGNQITAFKYKKIKLDRNSLIGDTGYKLETIAK